MKLKALDQMAVSAVQPDSLRPGQEFEISDAVGAELLKAHPSKFLRLDKPKRPAKPKAMAKPQNKKAQAPANKSA